ncbi:uncharacterized protein LOC124808914 isoform X2 [Hydra vulgaris]|nr:uncharacterized protein LOC124808914 isoform X2 [Hydra vulgaris]XP_047128030.1 uncharacterized protein LOC124808914 isoform X2 [Hydra vulgaris]XP_047128031.1 uncharacterized protein LOC124808914 isoform X2 [Hydra vulgaris]XP_047128032.1 uncharacterized protein LOC124808914 isoform X2 [Hydra vulgaris]
MAAYNEDFVKQFSSLQMGSSHKSLHTNQDSDSVLVNILLHILKETKVPVSLSFLNVTFKSSGLTWIISENFLLKRHDIFALSILGNDLKLCLRKTNEIFERTDDGLNIIGSINKDLTLISRIQNVLQNPIPFDEFCQKYNSNKYKVNLAFIVRNSHALRLSLVNGITYINLNKNGFYSDINEDDIWGCLRSDGFKTIFVRCLKGLLENFFEPVQLGNLQSCFNYGGWVIDKSFLKAHSDIFLGDGIRGITLNKNKFENKNLSSHNDEPIRKTLSSHNEVPSRKDMFENKNSSPCNEVLCRNDAETNLKSHFQKALVDFALQHDSSIVVLGSSNQQPPLIVEALGSNNTVKRLTALCSIRDYLNKEIEKELANTRNEIN